MSTLKEESNAYVKPETKNIADLEAVSLASPMQERTSKDKDGNEFKYKVVIVADDEYRVPGCVLNAIKVILKEKPNTKTIKVKKSGSGLKTEYTVIVLE